MKAAAPALTVSGLTVHYGDMCALDGLNLSVNAGEIVGIIGPNGAGKTSFIRALCGRMKLSSGELSVAGQPLKSGRNRQKMIGLVPQDIGLYPHMSARENLLAFAKIMGMGGATARRGAVENALQSVDMTGKAETRVEHLSGGMKRRINVAAAIMHEPRILILDEPTAGADMPARDSIHRLARSIAASDKAVLLVTHELEQAEALCDKLLILGAGKRLAYDTPSKILAKCFGENREVMVRFAKPPSQDTLAALMPFKFTQGELPTIWTAMTRANEVTFVSAFMASLRGGNRLVREISVRRPGLPHLMAALERSGSLPKAAHA